MREFDLLGHIYAANRGLPGSVTIPPGDDMGGVRLPGGATGDDGGEVLVTVDQLAQGVHFDLGSTPLAKVARKAITRNLSDVAAMAAAPVAAVVAACLPRGFGDDNARLLFDHMHQVAAAYDCPIIGGDIATWGHPLILTVTILARGGEIKPVLRRGAKVGDVICVTGRLGGSLQMMTGEAARSASVPDGYAHHLDFEPRLAIARKLAGDPNTRPNCMIDLSDGLARDLGHLCRAAGLAADVDASCLPVSKAAEQASKTDGQPVWRHAVSDGEDYELCFTIDAVRAERRLPRQIDGVPITPIGTIVEPRGKTRINLVFADETIVALDELGWEHVG